MIRRLMRTVELREVQQKQLTFGSEETDVLIERIDMAIMERSVSSYNQNNIDGVKYDYIGFTVNENPRKGMYISDNGISYKINYVQHTKRYNMVYLERVI